MSPQRSTSPASSPAPKSKMSDAELTALFVEKTRLNKERKARKRANKYEAYMARIDAIPAAPLGPQGQWPIFGPMKVVNGKAVGGFSVRYAPVKEFSGKWEDDPYAKASIKTPEQIEKEAIEERLKYWPWRQTVPRNLVTLAPFLTNNLRALKPNQPFALSEAEDNCPVFEKLFSNELIGQKLVNLLFINHDTASKFALTSRRSFKYIRHYTAIWDFTRGEFGNCETKRDISPDHGHLIAKLKHGSVPPVVIITPVRGPMVTPGNIEELDKVKEVVDRQLYQRQVLHLHKMCTAMYNFADFFRNLQLHRIPFLTTEVLSLIIPPMRNLKVLGIYQCPLIHVGDTMELLHIIQVDKFEEKKNQISLDFYPRFHVGPISIPGDDTCVASYGVTWDNWNGDSRFAVWQLVSCIIYQAQKQNQDFVSKHTMFRQWLDKGPCWRIEETLATLQDLPGDTRTEFQKDTEFAVMVDYPNTRGSKNKFMSKQPNHPEGWQWKLERHPCYICELNPLGIFFYYKDIKDATDQGLTGAQVQMMCLACRLVRWLNNEQDHYKRYKRALIRRWLRDEVDQETGEETWNDTNMPNALEDFGSRNAMRRALHMDNLRYKAMMDKKDPLDKEYDERQIPYSKEEKGRLGMKNRSPTADTKDLVEDEWNAIDRSRTYAHGHGSPW